MFIRILVTLACCAVVTQLAVAQDVPALYGLSHIRNDSTAKTTTYYKWGNGPWKKVVIEQGKSMAFAYPYDGAAKSSPDLYVRIDVDTDGVKFVEHIVSRGHSPDDNSAKYGHHFTIKQLKGTDTRYIDAVTTGGEVKVTDATSTRPNIK
jgi:hypothetical protein